MKSIFLKTVGIISIIVGISTFIILIVKGGMEEILVVLIQGEIWVLAFILVPLYFIFIGFDYFRRGSRGNFNKLISASATLQLIGLIILFICLIIAMSVEFGALIWGLLGMPAGVLILIGIVLLIIGKVKIKNESTRAL